MPILKAFILANHFCPQILSNSPNRWNWSWKNIYTRNRYTHFLLLGSINSYAGLNLDIVTIKSNIVDFHLGDFPLDKVGDQSRRWKNFLADSPQVNVTLD
jgi:hypothetical protein